MAKGRKAALSSKPSIEDFDTLPTQNVTSNDYSNSTGNEETEQNPFSKFVYVDEMIKALNLGFTMNRNLIFFGKGGFGKSEISELFFMTKGITPFVMSMGSGTNPDRLFGGTDLSHFVGENPTGKLEYLVENSFMNHEYVIFEELFDAPAEVLEELKDILSSGYFRKGSQVFEIKTKFIVCCTNRTRDEFAKNASLQALLERFPLGFEVKWPDHKRTNYDFLFKVSRGSECPLISYICEKLSVNNKNISPRIALLAHDVFYTTATKAGADIDALAMVADFGDKANLKSIITDFSAFAKFKEIEVAAQKIYNEYQNVKNTVTIQELTDNYIEKYKKQLDAFNKLKTSDDLADDYAKVKKKLDSQLNTIQSHFIDLKKEETISDMLEI